MKWLRLLWLKHQEILIEAQVERGHVLLRDHRERLDRAELELKRIRRQIATTESPQTLLTQALRSRATR